MFGIVSTGPSSLAIDLTYDRKILDDAIKKISGNGLKPSDIIQGGRRGRSVRSALSRPRGVLDPHDLLGQFRARHQPAQGGVWVSNGFDFDPFAESRLGEDPVFGGRFGQTREEGQQQRDQFNRGQTFADADGA